MSRRCLPDLFPTDGHRRPRWRRVLLIVGGVLCLLLGVVGWLVPIVSGIPFYVLGTVLLASAVPSLGHRLNAWESRLPRRTRLLLRPRLRHQRRHQAPRRAVTVPVSCEIRER